MRSRPIRCVRQDAALSLLQLVWGRTKVVTSDFTRSRMSMAAETFPGYKIDTLDNRIVNPVLTQDESIHEVYTQLRREDPLHVTPAEHRIGLEHERDHARDDGACIRSSLPLLGTAAACCRDVPAVAVLSCVAARRGDEERRARRRVIRVQAELVGGADGDREARVQVPLHVDVLTLVVLVA